MIRTWRWFGKKDKITLAMLRQIGVQGIVTALHDIPNGEVWSREQIRDLRTYIESYGMTWSVVESLPVSEAIKYAGAGRDRLISNYIESLRNLALEGVKNVCYNFMPVLDWARTDLLHPNPNGSSNLYFSHAQFAYFDIHILKRPGAEASWPANVLAEVEALKAKMTPEDEHTCVLTELQTRFLKKEDRFSLPQTTETQTMPSTKTAPPTRHTPSIPSPSSIFPMTKTPG